MDIRPYRSVSIHTPVKGATRFRVRKPGRLSRFNPHAREGRDLHLLEKVLDIDVSIHTPVKGATKCTGIGAP